MKASKNLKAIQSVVNNEQGAIGYMLAWFMGVPVTLLLVIYVLRGFT